MKGNLEKIKTLFLLIILIINFGCTTLNAENKTRHILHSYLDKWLKDRGKFKFIQINLIVDCKNELLFTISKKDLIYDYEKKYKTYNYKGILILYQLDDNIINQKNTNFFDKYFKKIDFDIKMLKKGNQSLINGYYLYFKNNKLITDEQRALFFIENNCKSDVNN